MQARISARARQVLLELGRRSRETELNNQLWPSFQGRGMSWVGLKETLDWLKVNKLVMEGQRQVEGYRLALFYQLTENGKERLKEIHQQAGGEKK